MGTSNLIWKTKYSKLITIWHLFYREKIRNFKNAHVLWAIYSRTAHSNTHTNQNDNLWHEICIYLDFKFLKIHNWPPYMNRNTEDKEARNRRQKEKMLKFYLFSNSKYCIYKVYVKMCLCSFYILAWGEQKVSEYL